MVDLHVGETCKKIGHSSLVCKTKSARDKKQLSRLHSVKQILTESESKGKCLADVSVFVGE